MRFVCQVSSGVQLEFSNPWSPVSMIDIGDIGNIGIGIKVYKNLARVLSMNTQVDI